MAELPQSTIESKVGAHDTLALRPVAMNLPRTPTRAVQTCRRLRLIAITVASLCVAAGAAYAGFALPDATATHAAAPELRSGTSPLTWTIYLPLIARPPEVRFGIMGYDCCNGSRGQFEHVHFKNFGSTAINITGWKIYSPATGDSYTFPAASAPPFSSTNKEMTLNTNYTGNVDNVYVFNWNINTDEWPNAIGVVHYAYMYDAGRRLVATCAYTPANGDGGDANCQ